MNIANLQASLRQFAAERDWQPFHTPKNLATALMVEAAELAEIFQWMTPEASREAHGDAELKQRIGEEIADVLLYLLQVADHTQTDLQQAVQDKLVRNAQKYRPVRSVDLSPPPVPLRAETHVLLDYENVQPAEDELRTLIPGVSELWVFHGPHQRQVAKQFASFGDRMTLVPISKTGKNALDFHLSFYMGYIASRHPKARIVVVANDKGYEPMLAHAKELGFAVRQQGHARAAFVGAEQKVPGGVLRVAAVLEEKAMVKKATPRKPAAKQASVAKPLAVKKPAAKKTKLPAAKKAVKASAPAKKPSQAVSAVRAANGSAAGSSATLKKLADSLRKMGKARPTKMVSLRRTLKALLGASASEESVTVALNNLIAKRIVAIQPNDQVTYLPGSTS